MQGAHDFATEHDRMWARHVWNKIASKRFTDTLGKLKRKLLIKYKTDNPQDLKDRGPGKIRKDVWNSICDYWCTPEAKDRSDAARKSRSATPEANVHCGGSRAFRYHRTDLVRTSL